MNNIWATSWEPKINIKKTQFLAGVSSCFGLCFLFGFLLFNNNWNDLVEDFQKWTFQSNLLALITSTWYFLLPYSKVFKKNTLIMFTGNNLFMAGFGFWLILLPTSFAGLEDYINDWNYWKKIKNSADFWQNKKFASYFFGIWNHLVTQIFYFSFMLCAFKNSNKKHLLPIRFGKLVKIIFIWLTFYILLFVLLMPFVTKFFPVYGIFTNFNPNTPFTLKTGKRLYSLKIACVTTILVYLISFLIAFFNWRTCVQYNYITLHQYMEKIDQ